MSLLECKDMERFLVTAFAFSLILFASGQVVNNHGNNFPIQTDTIWDLKQLLAFKHQLKYDMPTVADILQVLLNQHQVGQHQLSALENQMADLQKQQQLDQQQMMSQSKQQKADHDQIADLLKQQQLDQQQIMAFSKQQKADHDQIADLLKQEQLDQQQIMAFSKQQQADHDQIEALLKQQQLDQQHIVTLFKQQKADHDQIEALLKQQQLDQQQIVTLFKQQEVHCHKIADLKKQQKPDQQLIEEMSEQEIDHHQNAKLHKQWQIDQRKMPNTQKQLDTHHPQFMHIQKQLIGPNQVSTQQADTEGGYHKTVEHGIDREVNQHVDEEEQQQSNLNQFPVRENQLHDDRQQAVYLEQQLGQPEKRHVNKLHNGQTEKRIAPSTNNIAFHAMLAHDINHLGNSAELRFDRIITNIGGSYSSNTGTFTCSQDGLYVFSWALFVDSLYVYTDIVRNGNVIGSSLAGNGSGDKAGAGRGLVVVYLNAGDEVWIRIQEEANGGVTIDSQRGITEFSGFRVN
ncbi:involucrin-like [Argopecten irradians]|uniref:involucrin-like n=1 Tax=Argopecten irradians TaxID=31199 RepID=UPI0037242A6F